MSLLDDVSIVVTPNGYKAGELYAVIPVPTEGANVVTEGDFPSGTTTWSFAGGSELTTDGARINNTVTGINSYIKQVLSGIVSGRQFILTYDVITTNGTTLALEQYNAIQLNTSTTGTNRKLYFTWDRYNNDVIIKRLTTGTDVTIDNVILQELTSADMDVTRETAATRVDENGLVNYAEVIGSEEVTDGSFPSGTTAWSDGTGVTLSVGKAELLNTPTYSFSLSQTLTELTVGLTYLVSYEIDDYLSGQLRSRLGSNLGATISDDGVYEDLITAQSNSLIFQTIGVSFTGSIKNVSVKEVTRDNVPRIDYTGGGCPHILAEPQRTNLFPYSEDFSQWLNVSSTDTPNYSTAPDGTNTATRLLTSSQDSSYLYVSSLTISDATSYTLSIYVKSNGNGLDDFRLYTTTGGTSANLTATTEWQRFDYNLTSTTTWTNIGIRGVGGQDTDVLVWGAQVEVGSYPTSLIPTNGEAGGVTRNQDIFTRDGIGSLINSTEGVLFVEVAALSNDGVGKYYSLSDGTSSNRIRIGYSLTDNSIRALVISQGTNVFDYTHTISNIELFSKIALSYKQDDFSFWIDGVKVHTDTSGNTPTALSRLAFDNGSGGDKLFAKVKQLQVYDTALTDNQLIQLTGEAGTHFFESYAEMAEALTYTIQ